MGPPLGQWHAAVSRIPQESVLPLGFGSPSNEANVAAFLGDKLLGSAVALAQYESTSAARERGVGQLSELQGTATANRMLAAYLPTILPEHTNPSILGLAEAQEHTAGTMVEAAVAAVHQQLDESESGVAIAGLATFLVERAKEAVTFNFKGALLERGGTVRIKERGEMVRSESRAGGGAPPCYVAVAKLGTRECEAEAGSIRDSEHEAARLVLTQSGVELVGLPLKKRASLLPSTSPTVRKPRGATHGWVPVRLAAENAAANLANGETITQWWLRSAQKPSKAFHRAAMAPHCFGRVEHMDAYQRVLRPGKGCSALVVLCMRDADGAPLVESFASTAPSHNQALTRAALEANAAIISKLVDET